jgi:hypothetical protein
MYRKFKFFRVFSSIGFLVLNSLNSVPALAAGQVENYHVKNQVHAQVDRPVIEDDTKTISGVYVPDIFFYSVVQQPSNNPGYISPLEDLVTEFRLAANYGNIGLLAHNYLAGESFKDLSVGEEIYIYYKDGHTSLYTVREIYRFRALEPNSTQSQFVDLNTGEVLTANGVFYRMYTGAKHLTFQTCIYAEGESSWGRLFVIARPVSPSVGS